MSITKPKVINMSDHKTLEDLNKEENELKDSINKPDQGWFVLSSYLTEYGLSFIDAGLYTMIVNMSGRRGYAYPSNDFLCKELGLKERKSIATKLEDFRQKKLIYTHIYQTQAGKRREIVTQESACKYIKYLKKNHRFKQLQEFQKEFLDKIPFRPEPPDPKPRVKNTHADSKKENTPTNPIQNTDNQPCVVNPTEDKIKDDNSAWVKNTHPACVKNTHAYNTTYSNKDRTSGVTCKRPEGPEAANAAEVAVSFLEIRKELERSVSATDVLIGLKWYQLQAEAKRTAMKKPIACIMQALKDGYAEKEVAANDKEVAAQLEKKREERKQVKHRKTEMNVNEKLAHQIIFKYSECEGWKHKIDSKCFVVFNDKVEKTRDEETAISLCIMPNGKKRFGNPAVRVDFDLSPNEFKSLLKEFFVECNWKENVLKKEKTG